MSTMTVMMTKLGTSPVNADTAAATSRISDQRIAEPSDKGGQQALRFDRVDAVRSDRRKDSSGVGALRPVSVECSDCRRSASGRMARSDVPGAACSAAPLVERSPAFCGAAALGVTESGWFMSRARDGCGLRPRAAPTWRQSTARTHGHGSVYKPLSLRAWHLPQPCEWHRPGDADRRQRS